MIQHLEFRSDERNIQPGQRTCNGLGGIVSETVRTATIHMVGNAFRVPVQELCAPTRREKKVAFARQVAMYLIHVVFCLSLTEIGELFGRDRTTVAHACEVVEDRRDDPDFDFLLQHLECAIRRMVDVMGLCEVQN